MANTNSNPASAAAREAHRQRTGQFGQQHHTDPGSISHPVDQRFDTDTWADDLERCLNAATNYRVSLDHQQLRHIADNLLYGYDHMRFPLPSELRRQVLNGGPMTDYHFDTDQWIGDLNEAILHETDGTTRLTEDELRGTIRLLIDAQDDEWEPCQAASLHARQITERRDPEQARTDTVITSTCECGRTFTTDSRHPSTQCVVCTVQAFRASVEKMKTDRRDAELATLRNR